VLTPWHETEYRLKFDVSDRTLAARRLRLLACELGIGETLGTLWTPDAAALPRGLQGYMIRSLPMAGDAPALPRHDGFVSYLQSRYRRFYIDFDGDFEAYKQKFSAKTRSTFARKVRRLAEVCKGTDFRLYRTAAELEAFHGLARQVSQSTYQERLFDKDMKRMNVEYLMRMRRRFRDWFNEILARNPPRLEVDLDALSDQLTVIVEGAIIYSKALQDRGLMGKQTRLFRSQIRLLFGEN